MTPSKPASPFRPSKLNVSPIRRRESRDRSTGRPKVVYWVRVQVDGWEWQQTFSRRGHADVWAQRLRENHAAGWWFDPALVEMVDPEPGEQEPDDATVFSTTRDYMRSGWPGWRPNTRRHYARYLSRARRWLLRAEAPAVDDELAAALDRYAEEVSLRLTGCWDGGRVDYVEDVPGDLIAAAEWLERWSLPVRQVDGDAIRSLLARYDYYIPKHPASVPPPEPVRSKASTREGMTRHTKSWWNWLRDAGQVSHDPFRAAKRPAQAKAARRAQHISVDPDIVLSPVLLFLFAQHIAAAHPAGEKWRIYAPLLGLEGLRPGEALALRRRCFELSPENDERSCGWLVFDEQRPTSRSRRFVDPEERDALRSPLKGRDPGEYRRVPIFPQLVAHLRRHLSLHVDDSPDALVLTGVQGGPLDPKWFARNVWEPARAAFVEELRASGCYPERVLRKLEALRRHDLRHSAASFWLRAPVSPKLAQKWGGWRELSTFLDVYQGIMPGEEDDAIEAVSAYLAELGMPPAR